MRGRLPMAILMACVLIGATLPDEAMAEARKRRQVQRHARPAPVRVLTWEAGLELGLLSGGAWGLGWTVTPGAGLAWRPASRWRLEAGGGLLVAGRSRERSVAGDGFPELTLRTTLLGWGPELRLGGVYVGRGWRAGIAVGGGAWRYDVEARTEVSSERAAATGSTLRAELSGAVRVATRQWLRLSAGWRRLGVDDPLLGAGDVGGGEVALGYHYTF